MGDIMSIELSSHERFKRMFEHREADRIPIIDYPWDTTIKRWHSEGMPENVDFNKYFGIDKIETIQIDSSPGYSFEILEDTSEYWIYRNVWGTIEKRLKDEKAEMPQFIDYVGKTYEGWLKMKERMTYSENRIPWEYLKKNYKQWKNDNCWIQAQIQFGFNLASAYFTGLESFLIALIEDPQWCYEMLDYSIDLNLRLLDKLWDDGYEFDAVFWCDDMGYKGTTFFSINTYREIIKPIHMKAINWAHSKGIQAHLHSCGNVMAFVSEFVNMGIDALNPLEIKAGMDPVKIKNEYGNKLLLHGGINSMLWTDIGAVEDEIKVLLPIVKQKGGYIFSSDHSVPNNVSLENFKRITTLAKELGRY